MPEKLDEQTMALRVAKEFEDGQVVNLGFGIPTQASNYIPEDKEVVFQAENGVLGCSSYSNPSCRRLLLYQLLSIR